MQEVPTFSVLQLKTDATEGESRLRTILNPQTIAHSIPLPFTMPARNIADVLSDLPTIRDIPMGKLNVIAAAMRIDERAAKHVLRERVETLTQNAGIVLGFRKGVCGDDHGTTTGVRPHTVGTVWLYVSIAFRCSWMSRTHRIRSVP